MKGLLKKLGSRETAVIALLLIIFTAGLIIKFSGWRIPDRFDYSETDRQFEQKTKADFNTLKQQQLNDLQKEKSSEIKHLADSLILDIDNDSKNKLLNLNVSLNINSAYAADLMKLPGIGEVMADRIIEYREKNGGFKNIEDLMKIKGIGKKKFDKIKPYITTE